MYVCVKCNDVVGSERTARCPRGHLLRTATIGSTREETFRRAALEEFGGVCLFFSIAALAQRLWGRSDTVQGFPALVIFLAVADAFSAAIRSGIWTKRGGAVARLVPRANGIAAGNAAGVAVCLLAGIRTGLLGDIFQPSAAIEAAIESVPGAAWGIAILLAVYWACKPAFVTFLKR